MVVNQMKSFPFFRSIFFTFSYLLACRLTLSSATAEISSRTAVPPTMLNGDIIDGLSNKVRDILNNFQIPEPEINSIQPGHKLAEEPLLVPDTNVTFALVSGGLYNVTVHGLTNFTIESIKDAFKQMEVSAVIKLDKFYIIGEAIIDTMLGLQSHAEFNITLMNITCESSVFLTSKPNGSFVANKSVTEITYEDLIVSEVSTSSNGMLQTALSSFGTAVFISAKPYILKRIEEYVIREVNTNFLKASKMPEAGDISAVDLAIIEGRKFVATVYEPLVINEILDHDSQFLTVHVGPVTVRGVSKFSRLGSVPVNLVNGNIVISLTIKTGILKGDCKFFYDFGKIGILREGFAFFTVSYLKFTASVYQSIDVRKKLTLDRLELEIGKIDIHLDGNGILDYFVDTALNLLPEMLSRIIINALEGPVKRRIQRDILDKISFSELIGGPIPFIDSFLPSSI